MRETATASRRPEPQSQGLTYGPARPGAGGRCPPRACVAELPSLIEEITAGTIAVQARPVPLAEVEQAWTAKEVPGERIVLIP